MNEYFGVIDDDQVENTWNIEAMERTKRQKQKGGKEKKEKSENKVEILEARYRCEQLNISRINGEIVTLHSNIKTQYSFKIAPTILEMCIKLDDYIFSVEPISFQDGIEFSKKIETTINSDIKLNYNEQAEIIRIWNLDDLKRKWEKFRDTDLPQIKLYKQVKAKAPELAQDIFDTGNLEYSSTKELAKVLDKNLFYHVMIRVSAGDKLQKYTIIQPSQLFPKLKLITNVEKIKTKETDMQILYKLHGILDRSNLSEKELKKQYDEYYKPMIKYNYTEFDYIYDINYTIEKATGLLVNAHVSLCEKIKNNFDAITEFIIRRVEL